MRKERWLVVLLWIVWPVVVAQGVVWDFEKDLSAWSPRVSTLDIRRLPAVGATQTSRACLQITGIAADAYNYVLSDRVPMQGGRWYRLAGWVRVDMLGPGDPMPYFKCDFIPKDSSKTLGLVVTNKYNDVRMGTWQELSCQFEAPADTVAGLVALEKGTKSLTEIRALVDDVSLESITEAGIYGQYSVPGLSTALAGVRGVHPRLFLTNQRIAELKQAIQTTHAGLWSEIKARADSLVAVNPPRYTASSSDPGQLWQRSVGNAMPYLALAYRLTGQTKYREAAKLWALASCSYPEWGVAGRNNTDLATGHQLFGLALVYDWCYYDLDKPTRDRIHSTLVARATAMFQMAAKGQLWWHNLYMQNHMWVNICGLGAAGLAVFDEDDDALLWVGMAVRKLQTTLDVLGPDGAGHEGVGYWEYGVEHMLKLMYLARELLDIDFYDNAWWKNTARYSLYLSLPRSSWARYNSAVNFADSPPHHWYGPDHILRHLAAVYNDGYAQWLADQIDTAEVESSNAQWLNLIWYKPSVALRHPRTLPTLRHFTDLGIVSARSGWTGDESLVALKCGPFIGHKAIMEFTYDPGGHHTHPDAGHFVVFANGEWLFPDDGVGLKWTNQHNTLLIGGKGQLGEGSDNFVSREYLDTRARPRILTTRSEAQYDHIAADVTEAYPRSMGLQRFVRHLIFVRPDVLLVLDDVLCGSQKDMELRFHPASSVCETAGNSTIAITTQTALHMELLTPKDVTTRTDKPSSGDPAVVRYLKTGREWRNVVALSWADVRKELPLVTLKTTTKPWTFLVDGKTVTFDWDLGRAAMEP